MTTRIESHSRPWQWSAHVYVDEVDLEEWSAERRQLLADAMSLLREAVAGPDADEDGRGVSVETHCPTCGRPYGWTRESIVAAIQRWATEHDGAPPKYRDWKAANRPDGNRWPSQKVIASRFGTFSEALHAAGFETKVTQHDPELRERALLLGDTTLGVFEIARHLGLPPTTVASWLSEAAAA